MKKQRIQEVSAEETRSNTVKIEKIIYLMNNLNAKNERIAQAFDGDQKYARSFKKVIYDATGKEPDSIRENPSVYRVMKNSKDALDDEVEKNSAVLENTPYFDKKTIQTLLQIQKGSDNKLNPNEIKSISKLLTKEYRDEYEGVH